MGLLKELDGSGKEVLAYIHSFNPLEWNALTTTTAAVCIDAVHRTKARPDKVSSGAVAAACHDVPAHRLTVRVAAAEG